MHQWVNEKSLAVKPMRYLPPKIAEVKKSAALLLMAPQGNALKRLLFD